MRFFIMGFNDINAVFTELEEALGDIIPKAVHDANREQGIAQVKKGLITDLRSFTTDLSLRGMAHATVTRDKGAYRFVLKNPFNKDYLMGRIMGVMEALEGPPGEPAVKEAKGLLEITVTMQ
jgi:hypothetical protein